MRNSLLITAAAAALLAAQPAHAADAALYEQVYGYGGDESGAVWVSGTDALGINSYFIVYVYETDNGYVLQCFTNGANPYADVVSTGGSGKTGSLNVADVDLECDDGSLDSLTLTCEHDDYSFSHHVGSTTQTIEGNRYKYHGESKTGSASCNAEINGVQYNLSGSIYRSQQRGTD